MYECTICNYYTEKKNTFIKHSTSKNHVLNVKNYYDRIEKIKFSKRNNKITSNISKLIEQNEKIIENQNKITNSIENIKDNVKFLNKYCPYVDKIKLLTNTEIENILKLNKYENNEFENTIIKYQMNKTLHCKIGNLILKKYKKNPENIKNQLVWTSDISRIIYLIFQDKSWIRNHHGNIVSELIVEPIILKIKSIIIPYAQKILNSLSYEHTDNKSCKINMVNEVVMFNNDKYCNTLKLNILKYMAGEFSLNKSKNEIINQSKINTKSS